MTSEDEHILAKKLDVLIELMQQTPALELSKIGVSQKNIAKRLHVATAKVNEMLKDVKKDKQYE